MEDGSGFGNRSDLRLLPVAPRQRDLRLPFVVLVACSHRAVEPTPSQVEGQSRRLADQAALVVGILDRHVWTAPGDPRGADGAIRERPRAEPRRPDPHANAGLLVG